jgi:hypothetical protein
LSPSPSCKTVGLVLLWLLVCGVLPAYGKDLAGYVRIKGAGNVLPGVRVAIEALRLQTASGENGAYRLGGVPSGRHRVRFSLPGYRTLALEVVITDADGMLALDAELEIRFGDRVEEVRVTGRREGETSEGLSRYTLRRGDMPPLAGTVEDIGRQMAFLPAIAHVSDLSNDLIVRGGSPFENGYYVDNIPVTNINHFQREGSGGGVIGIINPDMIEETAFHVGAFPARFGDRLSSIIDLRFREGRRDRMHYQADLNAAGFSLCAEGPLLGPRAAFVASIRRSFLDLLAGAFSDQIVPRYGDIHFKADWQPDEKNHFTLLTVVGDSAVAFDLQKAVELEYNSYIDNETHELTAGLNWQRTWGEGVLTETSLSISRSKRRDTLTKVEKNSLYEARREAETRLTLRSVGNWDAGGGHALEFGFELSREKADFYNFFAAHLNRWGDHFPGLTLDGLFRVFKGGVFLSWLWRPWAGFSVTAGVRGDYSSFNERVLFSPRLTLAWSVLPALTLRAAVGLHHQQLYPMLLARNPDAAHMGVPQALHLILGGEWRPEANALISLEVYFKGYRELPLTPDDPTLFVMDNGVALTGFHHYTEITGSGRAWAAGAELFLRKRFAAGISLLGSASLFRARYRDLTGQWRNRLYDNQLVANLAIGWEFATRWDLGLRWNYAGGTPFSPYDLDRSQAANFGIIDPERIMGARYPPYHALSLRLDRLFVLRKSRLGAYINLLNVYNRENVARYYWSTQKQLIETVHQVGFIPVIGCRYEF